MISKLIDYAAIVFLVLISEAILIGISMLCSWKFALFMILVQTLGFVFIKAIYRIEKWWHS